MTGDRGGWKRLADEAEKKLQAASHSRQREKEEERESLMVWLNNHLVDLSHNLWWYPLLAHDPWHLPPVVTSTLCPLVPFCIHVSIALHVASQMFKFGDLWQLGRLHLNTS